MGPVPSGDAADAAQPTASRLGKLYAATVTPLANAGDTIDLEAIPSVADFLVRGTVDGLLVLGTTGEGILLRPDERREVLEAFIAAIGHRVSVIAHCGAQTTLETSQLSAHAADAGADGVAVIAPPYFAFDDKSLLHHFAEAARACAPKPFYVYEFEARSGYSVPVRVIEELRAVVGNLEGLKVSDSPWDRVRPYILDGLSVFVGAEALIRRGLHSGAAGTVSGLAAALPEFVASRLTSASADDDLLAQSVRSMLQAFPFQAALKLVLADRGVQLKEDVRAPLRRLDADERSSFEGTLASLREHYLAG